MGEAAAASATRLSPALGMNVGRLVCFGDSVVVEDGKNVIEAALFWATNTNAPTDRPPEREID